MTQAELEQLRYLKLEIALDTRTLETLEQDLERAHGAHRWPDMVKDIRDTIEAKRRRCMAQRDALERYIAGIEDNYTRQVLTLRCAEGLSWKDVSLKMGGVYTTNCLRASIKRFLERDAKRAGT